MNNEKKKLDCDIVKDLLPLYYDDVVSETTKNAVKDHLGDCEGCLKEYRDFCIETPETKEENTGKRFGKMMNKQKIRQRIKMAIAAVVACLVLSGTYYGLTELRLVCTNDMEVYKAVQYQTEDGKEKLFLAYSTQPTGYTVDLDRREEDGKVVYEYRLLRPIIREKDDPDTSPGIAAVDIEGCDVFICEGKTVWTKEQNVSDDIPDYVYAYEYYKEHNKEKFNDVIGSEFIGSETGIGITIGKDLIGFHIGDRAISWNYDGKVIYDTRNEAK